MSTTAVLPLPEATPAAKYRRLIIAGFLGTVMENYDMTLYALVAPVVFDSLFFPKLDPHVATMLVFATFAMGFLARPLGAIVFGHYGDRAGRKTILVLTLAVMGIASTLIGVLPGYARIGIWAPVLLVFFRICQGFAIGGETGGAFVMALENAPDQKKRGFYSSLMQIPLGGSLGALVVAVATGVAGKVTFQAWAWRIPFLLSALLVLLGFYISNNIDESAVFATRQTRVRIPIVEVLRHWKKSLCCAMPGVMTQSSFYYLIAVFAIPFATKRYGMSQSVLTTGFLIANIVAMATVPLYGYISDRVGRRPVLMAGVLCLGLFIYPFFHLLAWRNQLLLCACIVAGAGLFHPLLFSQEPSFIGELWPTHVRYTGASVSKQVGSALGGGLAPLIATALMGRGQNFTPVIIYFWCIAAMGLAAAIFAPEGSKLVLTADHWTTADESSAKIVAAPAGN